MQIQMNFANIESSDALESHVRQQLDSSIGRFNDRLTRIEVHLADDNSPHKNGQFDKRCTLEARPRGGDPITVEAKAAEFYPAINDATRKLQSALTSRLDRPVDRTSV